MTIEPTTLTLVLSAVCSLCLAMGWLAKVLVEKNIRHRPQNGNNVKKDLKEDIKSLAQQVALDSTHNREDFAAVRTDINNIREIMMTKDDCKNLQHQKGISEIWTAIDVVKQSVITNDMCKELRKAIPH